MSGFANPFAQFGDYASNAVSTDELVTTSYLTGIPDPKQITDEQVSLIFRQLIKRDVRTKQRALSELDNWLSNQITGQKPVDSSIHLAYVQMYAKLALDNAPVIRVAAHQILGKLYKYLGKSCSKYLKLTVGTWSTSRFDPDAGVVGASQRALDEVFPGEKQQVLFDKMQTHIRDYIYDACANARAQTLSDMRYHTPEELNQKYTRLVKCCLDNLAAHPELFNLEDDRIQELVENGRLWKFISSADGMLARSAIRLAQAHVAELVPSVVSLWNELLRAARKKASGSGVALEIMQLMNVLTKRYPQQIWSPDNQDLRTDSFSSLAQFITADPPHISRFWPLLYNLVLMVPDLDVTKELSMLYKPMEKTVVHQLRYNFELEESAWGCFVSLAAKMGPKHLSRAFHAAEQRCHSPSVPMDALAKFLGRYASQEGVLTTIKAQLQNADQLPLEYLLVLATTHEFVDELNSLVVPKLVANGIGQLGKLTTIEPNLAVPSLTAEDDMKAMSPETIDGWLLIAVNARSANSQSIVNALLDSRQVSPIKILDFARGLSQRGVQLDFNDFILINLDDPELLIKAVNAHDTTFVSRETAVMALARLVSATLKSEDNLAILIRLIKDNADFVDQAIGENSDLRKGLAILATDDRRGIIESLKNLSVDDSILAAIDVDFASFDISKFDLAIPRDNCVNPLRAIVPVTALELNSGLSSCELLAEYGMYLLEEAKNSESLSVVAIIASFLSSWQLILSSKDQQSMPNTTEFWGHYSIPPAERVALARELWHKLEDVNYALAYHAAQALVQNGTLPLKELEIQFSRTFFAPTPTLKGAILAYFSAVPDNVQYDQMQRSLIREAVAGRIKDSEFMLIDRSLIPATVKVDCRNDDGIDIEVRKINTFGTLINDLDMIAFDGEGDIKQIVAFMALPIELVTLESILEFMGSLPHNGSGLDVQCSRKCLELCEELLDNGGSGSLDAIGDYVDFLALLSCQETPEIPWVLTMLPEIPNNIELNLEIKDSFAFPSLVSWLLLLRIAPSSRPEIEDRAWLSVWRWISQNINFNNHDDSVLAQFDAGKYSTYPPCSSQLALLLLYGLAKQYPNQLRTWYRDLRDRSFIKQVDQLFATLITPAIMHTLKNALKSTPPDAADSEEVVLSINEKQREVRATREIEDEMTIEVVISLPEQFPCRPGVVSINNLGGVSEAKKRGWLLEARQHIQSGGVEAALNAVLLRINNFLEGVEPCAICYMTVNDLNKLPNKSCSGCHNIYHAECLYKWFTSNTNNRLCPMCRNPM